MQGETCACAKQILENEDEDVYLVVSESRIPWWDDMSLQPRFQFEESENCSWKDIYLHIIKAAPA